MSSAEVSSADVRFSPKRGPGRPPDVNGEDTKEEIRRAARHLFALHGYFATTTRMIALEVGVTPAALHHYFGRKRDLVLSVWRSTIEEEFARLCAAVDAQDTFLGKVHALLDASHQATKRDRDALIFITSMREEARRTSELAVILEDTRAADLVRSIVDFGVSTGVIEEEHAAGVRGAISAVNLGATLLATDLGPKRVEALVEGCKRLFDGIVRPPPRRQVRSQTSSVRSSEARVKRTS